MNVLLSTAYWPNLQYFYYLLNSETAVIEQYENYTKQSFRNRTEILSANGALSISIPIFKEATKQPIRDLRISYAEAWQNKHWKAITSAYKNAPYFEFFEDDIKRFYTEMHEYLLNYNLEQIHLISKLFRNQLPVKLTESFQKSNEHVLDLREQIHPKKLFTEVEYANKGILLNQYYQVFDSKFGFTPNLSILDLLFNKGLGAIPYLYEQ
jgi:hypothetical protein